MEPSPASAWRVDLHVHTTMSDGDLELRRVVEVAARRGVSVGIADHVSRGNAAMFVSSERELEGYLGALESEPVLRGGEFCWCDDFWRDLPAAVAERFDYRIGSNHGFWLPDGSMASPWWGRLPAAWVGREQELMEILVDNLCDLVRQMPIDILAHPTLIPPALLRHEPDLAHWWTEPREERLVSALRGSGVALEISNRYRLPHDGLLARARDAGVRFSLGSDGHSEDEVGRLEWSRATARRLEIGEERIFLPARARAALAG
jgi:histidinol phosphatase-like PHP family hydrolase